jgi:CyaY protein
MLSEEDYVKLATRELGWLITALDEVDYDGVEAELENDIITLELPEGPDYVINSHRAARQIWMAAERKAWHFDYDPGEGCWLSDKGREELWATVTSALRRKFGTFPDLLRPEG